MSSPNVTDDERGDQRRDWQSNIIMTAGVMATILLAFILAQLDALQVRAVMEQTGLPIVNIQATAVAIGQIISLDRNTEGQSPAAIPIVESLGPIPNDSNPRPEFITGVSEEGVIFTVCGAVPEGWLLYTVQPGDTLASLAGATQSTVADLAAANCLSADQLSGGMQILVPQQPTTTLCGPPQWWVRYQVRPGDTLGGLAATRGTTIDEILRANCRETMDLQAGQSIFLPPGAPAGGGVFIPQPSLTPLPTPAPAATSAPLPTSPGGPPPVQPSSTPVIVPPSPTKIVPPTSAPPTFAPPTSAPPTFVPPTSPPPTSPPPTSPPPTSPPPTSPPPTSPPPTSPPPTSPPPTSPPPTSPPPTEPPPTEPPTAEPPTAEPPTTPPPDGRGR